MKRKIDKKIYDNLIYAMIESGISLPIFELAKKMDINLPDLFYEKLILNNEDKYKDQLSKNLLGIYGNFIATNYFLGLGFNVLNEFPVYDSNGNIITQSDVYFVDKYGMNNYCEVKTTQQIIDNIRNYVDYDESNKIGNYEDKDNEIIKYKNIGKKLIKQVDKLKTTKGKVNVIVFNGCYIDSIILNELRKKGVNIIYLGVNIKDLENYVNQIIDTIDNRINKKRMNKSLTA